MLALVGLIIGFIYDKDSSITKWAYIKSNTVGDVGEKGIYSQVPF